MHRGVEVGIFLTPGIDNDNFVAEALGNLAAYRLAERRRERLLWQVLRVKTSSAQHHYRIVLRHPERALDMGFKADLGSILKELSDLTVEQLHEQLLAAERAGLQFVKLRQVEEDVDFWRDDFWNFMGGPSGFAPPGNLP